MRRYTTLLFLAIFVISFLISPVTAHAASETVMTPLTTFFNENVTASYATSGDAKMVVPLDIASQGDVTINISHTPLQNDYTLKVYTDDSYIHMIHSFLLSTETDTHTLTLTAGGAETLYLCFTPTVAETVAVPYEFTISALLQQAKTQSVSSKKTLANGKWTKKKSIHPKSTHYYKVSASSNQYFYLTSNNSYVTVKLLDAKKKKSLSTPVSLKSSNNFHASFAVKKGTYYIAVTSSTTTTYQLNYHCSKVKNIAGNTFRSAKKISFKQQVLGTVSATATQRDSQFYKIKLNKTSKMQLAFYVENSNDRFTMTIYDANKEPLPSGTYKIGNASMLYVNSRAKMPAGTYYIEISKNIEQTSGSYSILARMK